MSDKEANVPVRQLMRDDGAVYTWTEELASDPRFQPITQEQYEGKEPMPVPQVRVAAMVAEIAQAEERVRETADIAEQAAGRLKILRAEEAQLNGLAISSVEASWRDEPPEVTVEVEVVGENAPEAAEAPQEPVDEPLAQEPKPAGRPTTRSDIDRLATKRDMVQYALAQFTFAMPEDLTVVAMRKELKRLDTERQAGGVL